MTVFAYPDYRESGSSWFDRIPSGWKCLPFKAVVSRLESGTSVNSDDRPVEGNELGVLKTSCVYTGAFDSRENKAIVPAEYSRTSCPIRVNHLIVSRMNTPDLIGAAGLVTQPADNLYLPDRLWQIGLQGAVPKFTHYWTRSAAYRSQVQAACSGTSSSMQNLSQAQLLGFHFPCPPVIEQSVIAAFLDRESGKIDALVTEQERLIALLKEKRQAVISHAVTKGLNVNVPMKDSGVLWLGEVPAHWTIVKFGQGVLFQEGPGIMADDFRDDGVPLLRISGVQTRWASLAGCNYLDPEKVSKRWSHFRLLLGDLVISGSASMGVVSEVNSEIEGSIPYTGLIRLQPRPGMSSKDFVRAFVLSAAFSNQVDRLKAGATIQHFGPTHLAQMFMALPPLNEQGQIAEYVNSTNERFDLLSEEATHAITLLRERRAALISAAVTGKIDVRDTVPAAQDAA